jgi:hypothetical protein
LLAREEKTGMAFVARRKPIEVMNLLGHKVMQPLRKKFSQRIVDIAHK